MFVALSGPDRFEFNDRTESPARPRQLAKLLWEVDDVFSLIEVVSIKRRI